MTIWHKEGVCGCLNQKIRKCKGRLVEYYESKGLDFFITCKRDGNHHPGSCHPEGDAIDFKRQRVHKSEIQEVCGKGFDVVEYPEPRDIYHVEYDPK